jgi:hypothetical protein
VKGGTFKFDRVKKVRFDKKKKKKGLDPSHPDFDSEAEYGSEDNNESEKSLSEEKDE